MTLTRSFVLAALAQAVAATNVVNPLPTATSFAGDEADPMGFSPKPTSAPKHSPHELFKRVNPPGITCGYVTADAFDPWTCYYGNYCGYRSELSMFGCCTSFYTVGTSYSLTGCTFQTQCYDSTAVAAKCTGTCLVNSSQLKCTQTGAPYCMEYYYTDIGYSIFGCTNTPSVVLPMAVTFAGEILSTATSSQNIPTVTVTPTVTPTVPATSASSASSASGSGAGISASSSSTSGPVPVPGPKTNTGAIAGGVVGGVAVLAGIAALLFFLLRKKGSKKTDQQQPPPPPMAQPAVAGGPQGPNPGPGKGPDAFVKPYPAGNVPQEVAAPPYQPMHNQYQQPGQYPPQQGQYNQSPGMLSPQPQASELAPTPHIPPSSPTLSSVSAGHSQSQQFTSPTQSFAAPMGATMGSPSAQEADSRTTSYYGSPQQQQPGRTVHEAPTEPMSFRASPSSNWNGPYHEMAG